MIDLYTAFLYDIRYATLFFNIVFIHYYSSDAVAEMVSMVILIERFLLALQQLFISF